MVDRVRFLFNRLRERLWFRPLLMCLLSLLGAFLAMGADELRVGDRLPVVSFDSVRTLLQIQASSMLVIATFAVGSMVASYASASTSATPRSFPLVVSDDVSQNALSTFIGAFIFSIISLVFLQNDFYEDAGRFALLGLAILTFAIVILTFIRWVDRIARLGRLGETIDIVEAAAQRSLLRRRSAPTLGAAAVGDHPGSHRRIQARTIGYVQRIDIDHLQAIAAEAGCRIVVEAMPGTFATPDRPLATVLPDEEKQEEQENDAGLDEPHRPDRSGPADTASSPGDRTPADRRAGRRATADVDDAMTADIIRAFRIGDSRTFDEDPRFGLIALSEIAGRALSPAVNDPGTAIDIVGTMVRLFAAWAEPADDDEEPKVTFDRVEMPELSPSDLLDDAFTATARDGAGSAEVSVRLQKALASLTSLGHPGLRRAAIRHSRSALERCERAMESPADLQAVRAAAAFSETP